MFEFSDISCILMLLQRYNFFCEFLPAKTFFVFSINSFSCFHYRCGARQWRLTQKIHAILQHFFHFTKYFFVKNSMIFSERFQLCFEFGELRWLGINYLHFSKWREHYRLLEPQTVKFPTKGY